MIYMETLTTSTLRNIRNKKKWNLVRLEAATGMSSQHISEIENGKRDPRLSSIERIAQALGYTIVLVPTKMAPTVRRFISRYSERKT